MEKGLEGEQFRVSARLDDMRSDMNFRFNLLICLLFAILGVYLTVLVINVSILLRLS